MLLPLAAITLSVPARAEVYMTLEQAQALLFPGATLTPDFRQLTDAEAQAIESDTDVDVRDRELRLWKASTGGWFIADEVVGKHEFIPIAVALDKDGALKGIEILEYRESYGSQVRDPAWRAQFLGKRHGAVLKLGADIANISGATLSSKHITDGVKRLLATYALAVAAR
ncbi:MAG TPA: FMN-binding protein [Alphaproteobacteria bacterium]|nr:FMN-binding protein [Alphaproteobacteria bacterium]